MGQGESTCTGAPASGGGARPVVRAGFLGAVRQGRACMGKQCGEISGLAGSRVAASRDAIQAVFGLLTRLFYTRAR